MAQREPEKKSSPYEKEKRLKVVTTGPGINSKKGPGPKGVFQQTGEKLSAEFNRGAKKPWVPPGGRAPQTDMKVAPPAEMSTGRGPGYDGSKGYTKK